MNTELANLTNTEIEQHEHFSGKLTLPGGYIYYTLFPGGDKLWYILKTPNGITLFSGNDYRPSHLYPTIDCVQSIVAGLSFLTIQEGATDQDYFKDYTPEQIAFRDSDVCEEINTLISDYEGLQFIKDVTHPEYEYYDNARKYFETHYTQTIG